MTTYALTRTTKQSGKQYALIETDEQFALSLIGFKAERDDWSAIAAGSKSDKHIRIRWRAKRGHATLFRDFDAALAFCANYTGSGLNGEYAIEPSTPPRPHSITGKPK